MIEIKLTEEQKVLSEIWDDHGEYLEMVPRDNLELVIRNILINKIIHERSK